MYNNVYFNAYLISKKFYDNSLFKWKMGKFIDIVDLLSIKISEKYRQFHASN